MGFGLPAAIGAALGKPKETVIDIAGDGSIQMNSQELATAFLECAPVKIAILNNGYLGMVRQWQQLFYQRRYSGSCLRRGKAPTSSSWPRPMVSLGLRRATRPDEVEEVIRQALSYDGPVVMDFQVEEEENVFPMVAPGAPYMI